MRMPSRTQFRVLEFHEQADEMMGHERPLTILDVGCGVTSPLAPLRGGDVKLMGLDISAAVMREAEATGEFDGYFCGDFRSVELPTVDVIAMFDFIEHFDKDDGYAVLRRAESLASKFVVVMTPTGFVPQGAEYGNEFQRHRSGWFPDDFVGRGYSVEGSRRYRPLYGYGAEPKLNIPGLARINKAAFLGLRVRKRPSRAFFLLAVKDVRGVAARWVESDRPG